VTTQTLAAVGASTLPRVNLMPPELEEKRRFRRLQLAMGGAVVVAVAAVGGLYFWAHGGVASAQTQLDTATSQHTVLQGQLNSLQSVRDVFAQVAAHETMLQQAMGDEVQWSHYLNDLSLRVPDNVWLTQMQVTQKQAQSGASVSSSASGSSAIVPTGIGNITFTGVALARDDVATWLESLAKEKGYTFPYFSQANEATIGARKVVDFTSTVTVTDAAKSGRYTKPAGS
jgi:Tfp pilus assembly protein PilN